MWAWLQLPSSSKLPSLAGTEVEGKESKLTSMSADPQQQPPALSTVHQAELEHIGTWGRPNSPYPDTNSSVTNPPTSNHHDNLSVEAQATPSEHAKNVIRHGGSTSDIDRSLSKNVSGPSLGFGESLEQVDLHHPLNSSSEAFGGISYTRTGRISQAKKGARGAHVCACGKVLHRSLECLTLKLLILTSDSHIAERSILGKDENISIGSNLVTNLLSRRHQQNHGEMLYCTHSDCDKGYHRADLLRLHEEKQ